MAARKIKQQALKPKMVRKNLKVRLQVKRLNAEMGIIREHQKFITEEQSKIGGQFVEIERQCHQLKEETKMIVKQTARTQIKLVLMFKILKAREGGDFVQAATLTNFLRFVPTELQALLNEFVSNERANASSSAEVKEERP